MNNTKVIMIAGQKGTGKTTLANEMRNHMEDYTSMSCTVMSFASPLKDIAFSMYKDLDVTPEYAWDMLYTEAKEDTDYFNGERTSRQFIVALSETIIKKWFGQEVWIDKMFRQITECPFDYVIIDDLRQNNEWELMRGAFNSISINIDGDSVYSCQVDGTPTEAKFDWDVFSNGVNFLWDGDRDTNFVETYIQHLDEAFNNKG